MLRSFLERVTRDWVFERSLRVGGRKVSFLASPSGGLRYLVGSASRVDPPLVRCAERLVERGAVVWDIGANLGLFSFCSAALAGREGRVIAIEPDPWLVALLRRSTAMQAPTSAPVEVIEAAIGRADGTREFAIARRSRATSHLSGYGTTQTGGILETRVVRTLALDSLLAEHPPPQVVKIDVEGAELEVLEGAEHLLSAIRPVLVCEVACENSAAVTTLLRQRGYRIEDGEDGAPRDMAPDFTVARVVEPDAPR